MTASLFPDLVPVDLTPPETAEKLSAGRRLTLRQKADVERGRHPLTRGPLANNGETCGTCVHRVLSHWHTRSYPKCALGIDPQTEPLDRAPFAAHSSASDCRAWWPACRSWAPKDGDA